jgi:hypothetical protein
MLTFENYFSQEMNIKFMSASQFKSFMECEAATIAGICGEWQEETTTALLVGSYVDAHFSKSLDLFKAQNPAIFTQKGELKSEYKHAEYIIQRIERDEMFMRYVSGEQQVTRIGEIDGVPFKIRIDSYHEGKAIVDLKCMRDFEPVWKNGLKLTFVEAWGYDIQGAIYQAIEGNNLPFFIAAATKEKPEPDIAIISIPQGRIDYCMTEIIKPNIQRFAAIKKGEQEPTRCEKCDYCKATKILDDIVPYDQIGV